VKNSSEGRGALVLVAIFLHDHRDEIARGRLVNVILLGVGAVPRPERAAKHDAFPAREKHLRGADCKAVVAVRITALVGKADVTDARAHVRERPGSAAILVICAGCELPCDDFRIFDPAFRPPVALQEVIRRERGLTHNLSLSMSRGAADINLESLKINENMLQQNRIICDMKKAATKP
jgi:hypothetical protein